MPKVKLRFLFISLYTMILLLVLTNPDLNALNGNLTLTEEQIKEVEKDAQAIIKGCSYRLDLKIDPGKLCDAYSTYLHDKCERLDNLPDYCGPSAQYYPKRVIQKQCVLNPPLPIDKEGIERCLNYLTFNSSYSISPLILSLKNFDSYSLVGDLTSAFSVYNPNGVPMKLVSIAYNISKNHTALVSGGIGWNQPDPTPCANCNYTIGYTIEPFETNEFSDTKSFVHPRAASIITSNSPFTINGTYRYENSSSGIVSKQFSFTSK